MNYYMGVDIGGTKTAFGLFDTDKNLIKRVQINSNAEKNPYDFFDDIIEKIIEFEAIVEKEGGRLFGVGLGVPGFVNFEKGSLSKVPSLPNLNGFSVSDYIKSKLKNDIVAVVDNDCHCGALAEFRHGAGVGHRNMLYCPVSTGISTGMILNGELFRGSNGASGESGHMLAAVDEDLKIPCMCGNAGCFNSLCSGKGIILYIQKWISLGESSIMPEIAGGSNNITARHINEAYDLGDALAIRAVEQMSYYMAVWIFNVYMLLNVDCIIFNGGLLSMGDKLFGRMRSYFEKMHTNGFPVEFKNALLDDPGIVGAMELLF